MKKQEIKDLNKIERVKMADIKTLSKDKMYRLGYKQGFNVCRRRIRKVLLKVITKNV